MNDYDNASILELRKRFRASRNIPIVPEECELYCLSNEGMSFLEYRLTSQDLKILENVMERNTGYNFARLREEIDFRSSAIIKKTDTPNKDNSVLTVPTSASRSLGNDSPKFVFPGGKIIPERIPFDAFKFAEFWANHKSAYMDAFDNGSSLMKLLDNGSSLMKLLDNGDNDEKELTPLEELAIETIDKNFKDGLSEVRREMYREVREELGLIFIGRHKEIKLSNIKEKIRNSLNEEDIDFIYNKIGKALGIIPNGISQDNFRAEFVLLTKILIDGSIESQRRLELEEKIRNSLNEEDIDFIYNKIGKALGIIPNGISQDEFRRNFVLLTSVLNIKDEHGRDVPYIKSADPVGIFLDPYKIAVDGMESGAKKMFVSFNYLLEVRGSMNDVDRVAKEWYRKNRQANSEISGIRWASLAEVVTQGYDENKSNYLNSVPYISRRLGYLKDVITKPRLGYVGGKTSNSSNGQSPALIGVPEPFEKSNHYTRVLKESKG